MIKTSGGRQSSAFSWWLRTGKLPPALGPDGLEFKFNPWHDPADGRFTFAGAGRRYGAGGADAAGGENSRTSTSTGSVPTSRKRSKSQSATLPIAGTPRAGPPTGEDRRPVKPAPLALQSKRIKGRRPGNEPNPLNEFVGALAKDFTMSGKKRRPESMRR